MSSSQREADSAPDRWRSNSRPPERSSARPPDPPERSSARPPDPPERSSARPLEILARGPWELEKITARWHERRFEPSQETTKAADDAIARLRERGSPSHDGLAARLVAYHETAEGLDLELQPVRWALRLVDGDASHSVAALCVTRSSDGRWLAGRRAPWLSSWPGRWALGAGGAVDLRENPADTLVRELQEEWSVSPERVRAEALVRLPHGMVMFVGQAWLQSGAEVHPDEEHDVHAWWPRDVERWPAEATEPLRRMALWLDD
jgi:8-oxo-dGTP diphosphatase